MADRSCAYARRRGLHLIAGEPDRSDGERYQLSWPAVSRARKFLRTSLRRAILIFVENEPRRPDMERRAVGRRSRFDRLFLLLISIAFVRVNTRWIRSVSDPTAIRNLITDGGRDAGPTTNYRPSELLKRYRGSGRARSYRMEAFSGRGNAFSVFIPSRMKISRRWTFNGRRADVLTRPDTEGTNIFLETQGSPISAALTQKYAWPREIDDRWNSRSGSERTKTKMISSILDYDFCQCNFFPIDGRPRGTNDRGRIFVIFPRKISHLQFGVSTETRGMLTYINRRHKSRILTARRLQSLRTTLQLAAKTAAF